MIEESEKRGTVRIKSHAGILKRNIINVKINSSIGYFNLREFNLRLYSNTTIWELKELNFVYHFDNYVNIPDQN